MHRFGEPDDIPWIKMDNRYLKKYKQQQSWWTEIRPEISQYIFKFIHDRYSFFIFFTANIPMIVRNIADKAAEYKKDLRSSCMKLFDAEKITANVKGSLRISANTKSIK